MVLIATPVMYTVMGQTMPPPHPESIKHKSEPEGGVSNRYFRFGSYMVPHPSKKDKGGEDAFVAAHDLMVVADGVGGWARQGVDPGLFSKALAADFFGGFIQNNG